MIADKSLLLNESSMVDMQQLGLNGSKTSTSGAAAVRATLKNFSGASNQYAKLDDSQVVEEITGDSTGGSSTTTDEDNEPSLAKKCTYILVIIFSIICVGELPNIFGTQNPTSTTSRSSAGLTKSNSTSSTTSTATTTVAPLPFFTPASYNSSLGTGTWIDLCQSSLQGKVFCDSTLKDAIISFPNTTINVTNCQFNNCPGIVANSPMNFTNVSFIGSSSMGLSLPSSKYAGGGAFRTSSFATFNSCIFSGCTVMNMMSNAMYGGAVYADAGSNVTMVNCSFLHNSINYRGGAIAVMDGGRVRLANATFIQNMSPLSRGADLFLQTDLGALNQSSLWWNGGLSTGLGGDFGNTVASSGGSFALINSFARVSGVTFAGSRVAYNGAIVTAFANSTVYLNNITGFDLYSEETGALSSWSGSSIFCNRCNITGAVCASTIRGGGGCVTFAQSSSITVTNSIFTNATLLYSNAGELARISGYRGACHYDEIDAAIGIPSVVIYQNTTLDSCVITGIAQLATGVNASSFVVGSGSGGGFFSANGNLTISNVTVRNSIADTGGAVASLQAVFINITNSMFVSNSAYQFGGATSFWICKNVFMNNVIFANNSDNGEGTAVFVGDDSTTQVSLRNLAFSNPVYHQNTSCAILEAGYTLPGYFNLSDISFSSCPANVSNSNSILASALIGTLDPIQVSNLICN